MKQHFVTFYSPGTFVSESTTLPVENWNVEEAKTLAHSIKERYNAIPFGFRFSTRERGENDLDSKEVLVSGMYHLGGKLRDREDILKDTDRKNDILLDNMKWNNIEFVVWNTNSWLSVQPFKENDVLLNWKP